MTKVKICGITNLEDALLSAKFGADALGFNFYEKSPRYIEPVEAREIIDKLPDGILKVGVFVNDSIEKIVEIAETSGLDAIQLHGEESAAFVSELRKQTQCELIKAFRVSERFRPENIVEYDIDAVLLDGFSTNVHGGTGKTFDWNVAKQVSALVNRLYLAGGLSAINVSSAVVEVRPYAVDACSLLESEPGKKDPEQLRLFIAAVILND